MKYLLNFLPMVGFFIIYKLYDIFIASIFLIILAAITCITDWIFYKKIDKKNIINFISITFFSGLTLIFHNSNFIKWKITIIYFIIALCFFLSHYYVKQPLIQHLLEKKISLNPYIWKKLNMFWGFFFVFCSMINIYIAFWLPEHIWVFFKVFGIIGLFLIFVIINFVYLYYIA